MSEIVKAEGSRAGIVSTIEGADFATRKQITKAVINATPLADHVDKVIALVHVVATDQESVNENTGTLEAYKRFVLIDADGSAYVASSKGIANSIENILGVMDSPSTWDEPLGVVAHWEGKAPRKFLTLTLAD